MATHKSARKRARQSVKRRARNRTERTRVRSAVKRVRAAVVEGDTEKAPALLRDAERLLRKAASKGVIPSRRASRQVSRLARATHHLTKG